MKEVDRNLGKRFDYLDVESQNNARGLVWWIIRH